ncbi:MAG: hypothetical protein LBJ63_02710 [Prevotellaceae bacterium]|jgi:hypothetical protein|nr:hypothetical protein [Prevotellaceae bacterium]
MDNTDFIPTKDSAFAEWLQTVVAYLNAHATGWQIPAGTVTELTALQSDFASKFETAEHPATRTSVVMLAKTEARKAAEAKIREVLKAYVTYNPAVTDEDRKSMGLPIHKTTRTPSPVATDAPDTDIDTSVIGRVTIHFYEKGSRHKKAKPAGQHGAEISWVLSDIPVTRWDELIHSNIDTNSPFTLAFEHDRVLRSPLGKYTRRKVTMERNHERDNSVAVESLES